MKFDSPESDHSDVSDSIENLEQDNHIDAKENSKHFFLSRLFGRKENARSLKDNPAFQKAFLGTTALFETASDVLGGSAEARNIPNAAEINDYFPTTSQVVVTDNYDNRSLENVANNFGLSFHADSKKNGKEADNSIADMFVDAGQFIEAIGSDEDNRVEYLAEHGLRDNDEDNTNSNSDVPCGNDGGGGDDDGDDENSIDKLFHQKIKDIEFEPIESKSISDSFRDGKYKTVESTDDLTLYRVYGGGSEKTGRTDDNLIFLTSRKPTDRMAEKVDSALSNKWQGVIKDDSGKPLSNADGTLQKAFPNTREHYCEVTVPKGTHMNIGLVAPQDTFGGQRLDGGNTQIVVDKRGLTFGDERDVGFGGNYKEFSKKADSYRDTESDETLSTSSATLDSNGKSVDYFERVKVDRLPRTGGEWSGEPGQSTWIPDSNIVPGDRHGTNPDGKSWGEIKSEYSFDGVPFIDSEPIFSEISKGLVKIDDFSADRDSNFSQADEKLADSWGVFPG